MDPELETLEASFNNRVEQWISKQGLLFQLTHNTGAGSMFPKICGLLFRLLILGIIGLVIFWFYLSNRPNSEAFKEDVELQMATGLNAGEVEISNITRAKGGLLTGEMLFSTIALGETKQSFFEDWYVKEEDISVVGRRSVIEMKKTATLHGVHLSPLGIGDNYFSGWSGKELKILKMELKLKTGADSDEEAMTAYSSLFKKYESLNIDTIQIFDGTLLWGHSDISAGSIKGAQFNISKGLDSWEINVAGGTFSHNWLKDAVINNMKVICKRSGEVVIESASFSIGEGDLKLDASIQIKAQPEVTGNYSFDDVEVTDLIGASYEEWLDGYIDGKGELSGNLNSVEGVKITTTVNLTGKSKPSIGKDLNEESKDSVLIIRGDNIHLLKILQMKDPRSSYSLLRAHKGTLVIENQGEDTLVTVKDVRCGQNDLILMKGKFDYAVRTAKSKDKGIDATNLKLEESGKDYPEEPTGDLKYEKVADTARVFSGELELGLIPEVFENNVKVLEVYPVDNATLRVWFNVNLNGQLDELTVELADKLYEIMKKD